MKEAGVRLDGGSFRDPAGFVFFYDDHTYRTLDSVSFSLVQELETKGILSDLVGHGYLIDTRVIAPADSLCKTLQSHLPGEQHFLHHATVPHISYPYEWSFSMLADAAQLQLVLQQHLIERGYSLKDASAFNVQFLNCRPVFIDVLSIEKPRRKDVWIAYGQFCRMHLFPLLLKHYLNLSIRGYFLDNINGLPVEDVYRMFGRWSALKPSLFMDVFLQYYFQRAATDNMSPLKQKLAQGESSADAQLINLKRLARKIGKLASACKTASRWSDYINTHTYSPEAEEAKVRYIKEFLRRHAPGTVLDIGCNTGRYSLLACQSGAQVVAIDSDHDSVDLLYQHARNEQAAVLPLWVDIANPTPAVGFRNRERKSFMERVKGEAVFALALIHHLLITSRIPLNAICELFYDLTSRYLVVEFIEREDAMFQSLLALREDIYGKISRDAFLATFTKQFDLIDQCALSSTRALFTLKKK
jgi:SAM-dependent methyltransferase